MNNSEINIGDFINDLANYLGVDYYDLTRALMKIALKEKQGKL